MIELALFSRLFSSLEISVWRSFERRSSWRVWRRWLSWVAAPMTWRGGMRIRCKALECYELCKAQTEPEINWELSEMNHIEATDAWMRRDKWIVHKQMRSWLPTRWSFINKSKRFTSHINSSLNWKCGLCIVEVHVRMQSSIWFFQ